RKLLCSSPADEDYRRLRYADDFLFGFVGLANEAREIRDRIGEFLGRELKLTLSVEKTLITHAVDGRAKFLGHEIQAIRQGDLLAEDGRRATNGRISLLMPRKVVSKYRSRFSEKGKVI